MRTLHRECYCDCCTPFARRDIVPDRMWSHRSGDMLHVEIAVLAMPYEAAALVEGNLRQVVGVSTVTSLQPATLARVA